MSIILTVMSIFLAYIRRFSRDFESEQTVVFVAACIVIFALGCFYIAISQ